MASVFVLLRILVAAHGHVGGLIVAGSAHVSAGPYTRGVPVRPGTGYDGQFYYRLALDPLDWSRRAFGIQLDTLGRLDRVAYPAIVWLLSGGQVGPVPTMMVVANVLALGSLAWTSAALAREAGRHPSWGLLVAGSFGFLWTLSRDLTELVEAAFFAAGILALRRMMPVVAGLALSVAVLAREPALLVVGSVFVSRLLARSGRVGGAPTGGRPSLLGAQDACWVLPVAAFAGWQVALWARTGSVPALTSGNNNFGVPFAGLAAGAAHYLERLPHLASVLWAGELAILVLMGVYAGATLRTGAALLHERVAWVASVLLAISLTKGIWLGDVGFRSLDDFYLLSAILLLFSPRRLAIPALAVAGAWCVVAVELVLFI